MVKADEAARLAALRKYRILDTDPERGFDDLTLLASHICGTPIALITLVDAERQWFKSRVGLSTRETARSIAFCSHAIEQRDLYVIPDASRDAQFRDNPLVAGDPWIRFYAGAPLITPEGHALGTLCVLDRVPRTLSPAQVGALEALRRQAEAQLELRRNLIDLERALGERDRAELEQVRLMEELRTTLDEAEKLGALIPYCAACELAIVIPASPEKIPEITDGVSQMLREKNWGEREIMAVELALQEALANAIRHGCKNDPSRQVQCSVTIDASGELMIVIRDPGTGFDATSIPNPLDPDNVLKPSGRGVFLINQLMDEVNFAEGGRVVRMRKQRDKR